VAFADLSTGKFSIFYSFNLFMLLSFTHFVQFRYKEPADKQAGALWIFLRITIEKQQKKNRTTIVIFSKKYPTDFMRNYWHLHTIFVIHRK